MKREAQNPNAAPASYAEAQRAADVAALEQEALRLGFRVVARGVSDGGGEQPPRAGMDAAADMKGDLSFRRFIVHASWSADGCKVLIAGREMPADALATVGAACASALIAASSPRGSETPNADSLGTERCPR